MNSISGHVIVNSYFNKRRGIAQGIVSSGAGAGVFLLAPLHQYTLVQYGWRGTMLIFAGIVLQFCVCACLMRPYNANGASENSTVENSEISEKSETDSGSSSSPKEAKTVLVPLLKEKRDNNFELELSKPQSGFLTPILNGKCKRNHRTISEYAPDADKDDLLYATSLPNLSKSHIRKDHILVSKVDSQKFDIFRRKDIMYSGSLYHLKEFQESENTKSFLDSMTIRDKDENERTIRNKSATDNTCCSELKVLGEHLCDFTVFRNKVFIPILIGAIFIQMSQFIPNTFIAEYGYSIRLNEGEISAIVSLYGKANSLALEALSYHLFISYANLCIFGVNMFKICFMACLSCIFLVRICLKWFQRLFIHQSPAAFVVLFFSC